MTGDPAAQIDKHFTDGDVGNPAVPCQDGSKKHLVRLAQWRDEPYIDVVTAGKVSTTPTLPSDWNVSNSTKPEALGQMKRCRSGDIFVFDGHGVLAPKTWATIGLDTKHKQLTHLMTSSEMSLDEVKAAVRSSTVIVICGCKTFELVEKIAQDLSTNVKVGYGITHAGISDPSNLEANDCTRAAQAITAALMMNQTLDAAAAAGRRVITFSANTFGAGVDFSAPGLKGALTLQGNGLL